MNNINALYSKLNGSAFFVLEWKIWQRLRPSDIFNVLRPNFNSNPIRNAVATDCRWKSTAAYYNRIDMQEMVNRLKFEWSVSGEKATLQTSVFLFWCWITRRNAKQHSNALAVLSRDIRRLSEQCVATIVIWNFQKNIFFGNFPECFWKISAKFSQLLTGN